MSLSEFLHMGGYGFYVWLSYGLGAAVLVLNLLWPMVQRRRLLRELAARLRREEGI